MSRDVNDLMAIQVNNLFHQLVCDRFLYCDIVNKQVRRLLYAQLAPRASDDIAQGWISYQNEVSQLGE
jgi:hypothetical protein